MILHAPLARSVVEGGSGEIDREEVDVNMVRYYSTAFFPLSGFHDLIYIIHLVHALLFFFLLFCSKRGDQIVDLSVTRTLPTPP